MLNGDMLMDALNSVDDIYLLDLYQLVEMTASSRRRHKFWRTLLIAAVISALLAVTAYAVHLFSLREALVAGKYQAPEHHVAPSGELTTVWTDRSYFTFSGNTESAEYLASKEWIEYSEEYVGERISEMAAAGRTAWDWCEQNTVDALLGSSGVYAAMDTQMAEKLLAIAEKYSLKLHTERTVANSLEEFYALAGTAPFGLTGTGYVFEDGSFKNEGEIDIGSETVPYSFCKNMRGVMLPYTISVYPEGWEEWSYKSTCGVELSMAINYTPAPAYADGRQVILFCALDDAYITVTGAVSGGRASAEALADCFDFTAALQQGK